MSRYSYAAYDWRTGVIIDELHLRDVRFNQSLNNYGDFTAEVALEPKQRPYDIELSLQVARTAIFALRDGVPLWGGMLWVTDYEGDGSFKIGASEYGSWWDSRAIKRDQDGATVGDKDLFTHISDYYRDLHTSSYGAMGLVAGSNWYNKLCGARSEVTLATRDRQSYYSALEHLSRIDNGIDFGFDVRLSTASKPEFVLNVSYPWRGVTAATTQLVFSKSPSGGNIMKYSWPTDGTGLATTFEAIGDINIKNFTNTSMLASGYPPLDRSAMFSGVVNDSTLQAHATSEARLRSKPATLPRLLVRPSADPVIGSYSTGDVARIEIEDSRFPNGMLAYGRIISMSISPSHRGRAESVELLMDLV